MKHGEWITDRSLLLAVLNERGISAMYYQLSHIDIY